MSNRKRFLSADDSKPYEEPMAKRQKDDREPSEEPVAKRQKVTNQIIKQFRNKLQNTLNDNKFNDVQFLVGSRDNQQIFDANKFVFSTQSQPFEAMLFGPMAHSTNDPISIPDVKPAAFNYLHQLFYMKQPILTFDIIIDVLYAAKKYLINIVINDCKETLCSVDNMDNLYTVLISFGKYAAPVFHEDIEELIKNTKYTKENIKLNAFIEHSQFMQLSPFIIQNIIKSEIIPTEIMKYQLAKKYCTEFVKDNKDRNVSNEWQSIFNEKFLECIKLKELTTDYLLMVVKNDKIISSDVLLDIIDNKKSLGFKLCDVLLTEPQRRNLKVGDFVDIRDYEGAFYAAKVIEKINDQFGFQYIFGYSGFDSYRQISDWRWIARYKSVTGRKNYISRPCLKNVKSGDYIYVNFADHPYKGVDHTNKWRKCKIDSVDNQESHIFVNPLDDGDIYGLLYLEQKPCVHVDNQNECACSNENCTYCHRYLS